MQLGNCVRGWNTFYFLQKRKLWIKYSFFFQGSLSLQHESRLRIENFNKKYRRACGLVREEVCLGFMEGTFFYDAN